MIEQESLEEIVTEDDVNMLIIQLEALKQNEKIVKRNITNIKRKLNEFLDEHKMHRVETCTHELTRVQYDVERLLNKEQFQEKYGEEWISKNCKVSTSTRLNIKQKKGV